MNKSVLCLCTAASLMIASCGEKAPKDVPAVAVTKVTLKTLDLPLKEDEVSTALEYDLEPAEPTDKTAVWSSSDRNIATIENGVVTAKAAGTANITVTVGGVACMAPCVVRVSPKTIPVKSVTLNKRTLNLVEGEVSEPLTYTLDPADATERAAVWSCDTDDITVDKNGVVTAVAEGSAEITLTVGGVACTTPCIVFISKAIPATSFSFSESDVEVKVGETKSLTITYLPENANTHKELYVMGGFNDLFATVELKDGKLMITGKSDSSGPVEFETRFRTMESEGRQFVNVNVVPADK